MIKNEYYVVRIGNALFKVFKYLEYSGHKHYILEIFPSNMNRMFDDDSEIAERAELINDVVDYGLYLKEVFK